VVSREFGQYCGFARALELVGERWALLVIRDLLVGPKRFSELQRGLPKIPSNILTSRLKELEEAGIVQRRAQRRPASGSAYELTADGRELEDAVIALGRWGAKRLGVPRTGEIITADSMTMALRSIFRADAAADDALAFELHVGEVVVNAVVRDRAVSVGKGALPNPDLVIEAGPAIRALRSGAARVRGKRALLGRFVQLFRI
jgi:DNA-binding HxlR family transcriptional regulator